MILKEDSRRKHAFTLTELLVSIAAIALMAMLAIPALAHAGNRSPAASCISTMRQLMIGWSLYKEDHNDSLMPNASIGAGTAAWCNGTESWSSSDANTNASFLLTSLMAPYVGNDLHAYKCPADVVPSLNGQRLRSRSMNGQMGASSSVNAGWLSYTKGSDLNCPTPANAFIFCDEHPGTLNDGFLDLSLSTPSFPGIPANYHGNACGFSFADGHAEERHWTTSSLALPVTLGASFPTGSSASVQNADWIWLRLHSACQHH